MSNPKSAVLSTMTNKSYTMGWDVLVAYNAASVNDLFAAQYVSNVRNSDNFLPINETIDLTSSVSVQVDGLILGPPLISFSPNTSNQEALVTFNFISGAILQTEASGNLTYVTGAQNIVPGDDYQLQLTVPLEQVSGSVSVNQNVTVNLKSASSATTNLLPGTTAASYLGQYFASLFKKSTSGGLSYQLGTLVLNTSENLTPTSFQIRTQVYPGTQGPDGAVLLFVATKYNPAGGNEPGSSFPYLIPDGNTCTLAVASKTLFNNILAPYYHSTMVGSPTFSVLQFSSSPAASYMVANGGSLSAPPVTGSWSSGPAVTYSMWSGNCSYNPPAKVQIPYTGWTFEPQNDQLSLSWNNMSFNQQFAGNSTMRDSFCTTSDVTLTLNATMKAGLTVSNQIISLTKASSPNVNFSFKSSSWVSKWFGNGTVRDNAAATLANALTPVVSAAMEVPIPQVNTFAASHLLFPSANALSYSSAHLPGDLVVFGQVAPTQTQFTVDPLQTVLGPGETQQLSVSNNASVTWTIFPRFGSISAAGLYTAPSSVPASVPVAITATDNSGDVATAVVTVVPSAVTISPAYSIVLKSTPPLALQAAVLGNAAATWSIAPDDGSAGSISATGTYSPPTVFPTDLVTAVVTATAAGTSGTCLLCLANVSIAITLTPLSASLGPSATQQFSATPSTGVTWSVQPQVGSVDASGLYTAPATIAEPATVLVVATLDGAIYGFAPVFLSPFTS